MIKHKNKELDSSILEKCVCGGCTTEIPRALDISKRSYYIEGAGQLCGRCYQDLYGIQRKAYEEF